MKNQPSSLKVEYYMRKGRIAMNHHCSNCDRPEWKNAGNVKFNHEGLSVNILRPGGICMNCCREDFLLRFRMYSHCIKYEGGKIININWQGFHKEYDRESDIDNICELFLNLGIFSVNPEGNWQIVAGGSINRNPTYSSDIMYFTNFTDVVGYANFKYIKTAYSWHLQKIAEVCTRKDLGELGLLDRNEINLMFAKSAEKK